jgi:two-component system sensor histidine kinase/response regulator
MSGDAFYRVLLDALPLGIATLDRDGTILYANPHLASLLEAPAERIVGAPITDFLPEKKCAAATAALTRGDDGAPLEFGELLRSTGEPFPIAGSLWLVPYGSDPLACLTVSDLSASRHLEEELLASRETLTEARRLARLGGWEWNVVTNAFKWSDEIYALFGLTPGEIDPTFDTFVEHVHPGDRDSLQRAIDAALLDHEHFKLEFRAVRTDGDERVVVAQGEAFHDGEGRPLRMVGTTRDITEARRAARMHAVLESAPDAMVIADDSGTISLVNAQTERLFGYDRQEMVGEPVAMLVPGRLRDRHAKHVEGYFEKPTIRPMGVGLILQGRRKDGSEFPAEISLSPVPDGTTTAVSASIRDVTEHQLVEEELRAARDDALRASQLKSDFVANVSHEIRTPLNGVVGMAELLLATELRLDQREYADVIRTSADALMAVINDILDFSKIEAGKMELEAGDFGPRKLVDEVCAIVAGAAAGKGIELIVGADQNVPHSVRADGNRVQQVLGNLLSNAVKFTPSGEVAVRVSATEIQGGRLQLRFEVRDTGIGIASGDAARLFESFAQADSSTTREYGGTGLGLAIAKRLVELMGGRIGVQSTLGRGSTFWFTVPCDRRRFSRGEGDDWPDVRALIVEANATQRGNLQEMLTSWKVRCDTADNGPQALTILESGGDSGVRYDLLLVDLNLPEAEALALAREVRGHSELRSVHVVALAPPGARETARCGAFDAVLIKPVRQSQLYSEIAGLRKPSQPSTQDERDLRSTARPPDRDAAPRRVLVAEDNIVNQMVAVRLLEKLGYYADVANDGREAVEMSRRSDYAAILMDCQMPRLNGYAAAQEIRRREGAGGHIPIIAMTAHTMQGDREKCLAAGMDDYIGKPVRMHAFNEVIAHNIHRGGELETPDGGTHSTGEEASLQVLDPAQLADISAGDERIVSELVSLFKAETRRGIQELGHAVAGRDAVAVHEIAHRLKGASASVGARRMASVCDRLSRAGAAGELANLSAMQSELERAVELTNTALDNDLEGDTK